MTRLPAPISRRLKKFPRRPAKSPFAASMNCRQPSNVLEFPFSKTVKREAHPKLPTIYRLPSTELLNEIPLRSAFDEQELKNTAAADQSRSSKSSTCSARWCRSIPARWSPPSNSSPKPASNTAAITTLTEDLCLGLAGRIDPDRAHSRQADRRHRSSEHEARSHQPARSARIRRVRGIAPRT